MTALSLECIYFDIDGTLCNYGRDPRDALKQACEGVGLTADLDPFEYYDYYKAVAAEKPGGHYHDISNEAYLRLLQKEGYGDRRTAEKLGESYRRIRLASIELYPDTKEVLETLSGRYHLGIISNGPSEIQRDKLQRFGLANYFDTIIISGEVGVEKPSRTIFHLALRQSKAEAARSAHVGDNLSDDVKGALESGLTSFWVNRGVLSFEGVDVRPHYELLSLRDLLPILDR